MERTNWTRQPFEPWLDLTSTLDFPQGAKNVVIQGAAKVSGHKESGINFYGEKKNDTKTIRKSFPHKIYATWLVFFAQQVFFFCAQGLGLSLSLKPKP
jgi:hypothetical protein